MKKQLLTTTAMLAMVGGAASAQEWSMDVGGYYQSHAFFSDVSGAANVGTDNDGFDMFTDAEIIFKPSITLDNGVTFGAQVQLEGEPSPGSQIDETYITISSDTLGKVILGNENSASYLMWGATPGVGSLGIDSGTMSKFVPLVGSASGPNTFTDIAGDAQKISYITPSFSGLTLGVSYAPTTESSGSGDNSGAFDRDEAGRTTDAMSVAANYSQTFGTGSFYLGLKYQQATVNGATGAVDRDISNYGVAGSFSTAGFTFGAQYFEGDADNTTDAGDATAYSMGVTYDVAGPWTVGLDYINDEQDITNTTKYEQEAYRLGAARDMGPGVTVDVFAISYDGKNTGNAAERSKGTAIGSALTLSF